MYMGRCAGVGRGYMCCVKCVYFDIKIGGKDVGRITGTTQD